MELPPLVWFLVACDDPWSSSRGTGGSAYWGWLEPGGFSLREEYREGKIPDLSGPLWRTDLASSQGFKGKTCKGVQSDEAEGKA